MKKNPPPLLISFITVNLIILDQISKFWAMKNLTQPLPVIGDFFILEYTQNYGIAFGITAPYFLLIILNIILIPLILYLANKEFDLSHQFSIASISLILSGALGNFIDRIIHGFVVDFIAIGPWPNFNLADTYITIGILLIVIFHGKMARKNKSVA